MSTDLDCLSASLDELAAWVETADPHASVRLPWLRQAVDILAGREPADARGRRDLAEQLDRWRYQHLAQAEGRLSPTDRRLVDALDLAAVAIAAPAGCSADRPPRWPRGAIQSGDVGRTETARIAQCLSQDTPLDEVCRQARELTAENFGSSTIGGGATRSVRRRISLFAPLYLSNHCINHCVYCGFRNPNSIERKHLQPDEAIRQAEILMGRGFRQILLVAGDFPSLTTTGYFVEIVRRLVAAGVRPSIEIAPQSTGSYVAMAAAGACGITMFQETYDETLYALYHPRGSKRSYDWRLEALERAAEAGFKRIGLGFLLGLADPAEEIAAMARQAVYLRTRFPDCSLGFSLPRIRETPQGFVTPFPVDDDRFVRMYCALRIAFPKAELVLSTRELPEMRNRLAGICITSISAGSSTQPGGYDACDAQHPAGEQFPISDGRSPAEMVAWLRGQDFDVVWG